MEEYLFLLLLSLEFGMRKYGLLTESTKKAFSFMRDVL